MMRRTALTFLSCALAVILAGCSSTPKESLGKAALVNALAGSGEVVSFRKTDGRLLEVMGVKSYQMAFSATVKVLEDTDSIGKAKINDDLSNQEAALARMKGWRLMFRLALNSMTAGQSAKALEGGGPKKGDTVEVKGLIQFAKSENGWNATMVDTPL